MPRFLDRPNLHPKGFDHARDLPYGLRATEIRAAMEDIYDFLHNVNRFLIEKGWDRLEESLMAATFSGIVSEFAVQSVSKQSATLTKNTYPNGRPDLVPVAYYNDDSILRGPDGIEVKASRSSSSWQGHNVETGWIMIFQFALDTTAMPIEDREPTKFVRVLLAHLDDEDWSFSGRSGESRRTPTASIRQSGRNKLVASPVYLDPTYELPGRRARRRPPPQGEEST